jgi:hypothetical protein
MTGLANADRAPAVAEVVRRDGDVGGAAGSCDPGAEPVGGAAGEQWRVWLVLRPPDLADRLVPAPRRSKG